MHPTNANSKTRPRLTPVRETLSYNYRRTRIPREPKSLDVDLINDTWLVGLCGTSEHAYVMLECLLKQRDISAMNEHVSAKFNESGLLLQITPEMNPSTYLC